MKPYIGLEQFRRNKAKRRAGNNGRIENDIGIGIDAGGTKTDFLITTTDGDFIDFNHVVTHRKMSETNYTQLFTDLARQLKQTLKRNNINGPAAS